MDIRSLVNAALGLAKMASPLIPALGAGAKIGEKIIGIIDDLGDDIPLDKQAEAQATRSELAEAVKAKAKSTSSRLRGG